MVRIFLTGYMGAGKTTLGKAFARYMDIPFIDLDWYIEERFHKTVGELFIERGETGFRELERNMLHEVAEFENVVISTGGGAPLMQTNWKTVGRLKHRCNGYDNFWDYKIGTDYTDFTVPLNICMIE